GWTLVTGWLHAIVGIWAFHDLGKIFFVLFESMKPDKNSHDEEERVSPAVLVQLGISVMLRILAIVGVSMAVILIRGCKNKNPKQGWSLVIAWVQIIWGILALLALGKQSLSVLGVIKPDKDLQDELEIPPTAVLVLLGIYAVLAILAVLSIIMAIVLIRGCKNKNSKQLTIWIL
ncbi:unnamed protein product, partial [Allacma fusca]